MRMEKQITQSYVLLENGEAHTLLYYIVSEASQDGGVLYGIKIVQQHDGHTASASAVISPREEQTLQTIFFLAKNFVFPVSLPDIIEDMRHG